MDVIEGQEVLDSMRTMVGGAHAHRTTLSGPGHATHRPHLQGPPLIKADYDASRRAAAVELSDELFLRSKCGSVDVFHVRIRCAVSPSRRNRRRIHSSVTAGS